MAKQPTSTGKQNPDTATMGTINSAAAALSAAELQSILDQSLTGQVPSEAQALALAGVEDTAALANVAATLRDRGFRNTVTYSKKVFIPLTS